MSIIIYIDIYVIIDYFGLGNYIYNNFCVFIFYSITNSNQFLI